MKTVKYGNTLSLKEHLLEGKKITRLEAIVLFGISGLTPMISNLRKSGLFVESRKIPYATALKRVNEYASLTVPKELLIREIQLTEYWISK